MSNPSFEIEGSLVAPNIGNYYIGKGNVKIKLLGEDDYTHVGNCQTCALGEGHSA